MVGHYYYDIGKTRLQPLKSKNEGAYPKDLAPAWFQAVHAWVSEYVALIVIIGMFAVFGLLYLWAVCSQH